MLDPQKGMGLFFPALTRERRCMPWKDVSCEELEFGDRPRTKEGLPRHTIMSQYTSFSNFMLFLWKGFLPLSLWKQPPQSTQPPASYIGSLLIGPRHSPWALVCQVTGKKWFKWTYCIKVPCQKGCDHFDVYLKRPLNTTPPSPQLFFGLYIGKLRPLLAWPLKATYELPLLLSVMQAISWANLFPVRLKIQLPCPEHIKKTILVTACHRRNLVFLNNFLPSSKSHLSLL